MGIIDCWGTLTRFSSTNVTCSCFSQLSSPVTNTNSKRYKTSTVERWRNGCCNKRHGAAASTDCGPNSAAATASSPGAFVLLSSTTTGKLRQYGRLVRFDQRTGWIVVQEFKGYVSESGPASASVSLLSTIIAYGRVIRFPF